MSTRALSLPKQAARRGWRFPLGLLLPTSLLIVAEVGVRSGAVPANLLPAPSQVLQTIVELSGHGLGAHVASSPLRIAIGFAGGQNRQINQ